MSTVQVADMAVGSPTQSQSRSPVQSQSNTQRVSEPASPPRSDPAAENSSSTPPRRANASTGGSPQRRIARSGSFDGKFPLAAAPAASAAMARITSVAQFLKFSGGSSAKLAARPTHATIDPDEILTGEDLDRVLFFAQKFYESQGSAVKQIIFAAWEEYVVGKKLNAWKVSCAENKKYKYH